MAQTIHFINNYGYLAIFIIVFLQEVGVPTIIPNEISLLFFGYLCFTGLLNILWALLVVILADFTGALLLNLMAYYFSVTILSNEKNWCRFLNKKLQSLKMRIEKSGHTAILLGRITPFIRSYISIACGTLKIHPFKYSIIAFFTACIYTGSFVFIGWILGSYSKDLFNSNRNFFVVGVILCICIMVITYFISKKRIRSNT